MLRHLRQVLVNGHQVVRLATRIGEALLEEFVEGSELVKPPVLPGADLAKVAPQFHEFGVSLAFDACLPSENLLDLGQHEQGSLAIELRGHQRLSVNPKTGQANQGHSLPADE